MLEDQLLDQVRHLRSLPDDKNAGEAPARRPRRAVCGLCCVMVTGEAAVAADSIHLLYSSNLGAPTQQLGTHADGGGGAFPTLLK